MSAPVQSCQPITATIPVEVIQLMGKTEQADINFLLDRLGLARQGAAREIIASFRRQMIVVAAHEAAHRAALQSEKTP